ncbi:regulatory factor X-associated protein isoform X2 [Ambystoma mexicanum]|uniref:regulatory factor X-associated protein isoform X2 n=1 Tax=Ambystoma mexicanum TaxID=8296 RepID=UPI0037E77D74
MDGLRGPGAAPTVTLLLMQACEETDPPNTRQQGNLDLQQCTTEMQDATHVMQQSSPELLRQATPSMQQGSLIVQPSNMQVTVQQGSPELHQSSLELLQTSQGTLELAGIRVYYSMATPADDDLEEESEDPLETSDPRDSTASPEELELVLDEEYNSGDNESVTRNCTYPACAETCVQGAKQRKPWMCKKHRNKMYKDKYKKKKSDQAMTCNSGKLDEGTELCSIAIAKQRTGVSVGDRPSRPTLLEQVLNQKRLSLLRSPEVVQFLQTQQQLLSQQACEQRQPFQGASV